MPELKWVYGYYLVMGIIIAIASLTFHPTDAAVSSIPYDFELWKRSASLLICARLRPHFFHSASRRLGETYAQKWKRPKPLT